MSILLDALKRSESQRELGSVPTLQTSIEGVTSGGGEGKSWMAAVLILSAFGLMNWMVWTQFSLPDQSLTAPGGQQVNSAQVDRTQEVAANPPAARSLSEIATTTSSSGENILPKIDAPLVSEEQQSPTDERQSQQRRVGREFRQYAAGEESSAASESMSEPTLDNSVRQREIASVNLQPEEPPVSAINSETPYEPEIISYWQMPESTREGLPDLRISVLVYAEQAENRFLLLNGERIREGEELPNGLRLEEIQRDRAIFNYRNYRFHLKS
jgi:general secretion pathway protein B